MRPYHALVLLLSVTLPLYAAPAPVFTRRSSSKFPVDHSTPNTPKPQNLTPKNVASHTVNDGHRVEVHTYDHAPAATHKVIPGQDGNIHHFSIGSGNALQGGQPKFPARGPDQPHLEINHDQYHHKAEFGHIDDRKGQLVDRVHVWPKEPQSPQTPQSQTKGKESGWFSGWGRRRTGSGSEESGMHSGPSSPVTDASHSSRLSNLTTTGRGRGTSGSASSRDSIFEPRPESPVRDGYPTRESIFEPRR